MSIVTATVYSIATATNLKSAVLRGKSTFKKYQKFRPWICLNAHKAGSEVSSQSDMSRESSSLFEEGEGLMMEPVEVVGEGNIDEGSLLDREPDWRDAVKDFKDGRLSEGHVFKTSQESTEALMRLYEASGDIEDVFQDVLDEDQSDDDDVLDTEWVPSNCDMEEREDAKTGSQAGDNDEVTGELLGVFYKWLIDVDGGYRSDKMAQQ